ncbi:MAG: sugar transferase [Chloroflexota bacterium]|nr:sugar transferase [Chloroflexota bacterium]
MSEGTTPIRTTVIGQPKSHPVGDVLKRAFDLVISSLGLLFLWPVFLWIAWRIKRDSPGPAYYNGQRIGKDGVIFSILKFRTMHENPQSYQGPRITAEDDPRVTSYGRYLRDAKLNELPQLWNVLKGEMSLVGPRPEDPSVAADWPPDVRAEILSVRPGITSPSSVRYRKEEQLLNGEQVMDTYVTNIAPSKLRLDQLYVRQRSFWGDLDVLFWTTLVMLPAVGSYEPSDKRLFVGPLNELMGRYVNWFLVDLMVALAAIGITGLLWRSFSPLDVGWLTAFLFAVGFAILCSLMGSLFGVQRIYWSRSSGTDMLELIPAVFLATIIILLVNHFVLIKDPQNQYRAIIQIWNNEPLLPIAMILIASTMAYIGFVGVRYRTRLLTGAATRWLAWRGTSAGPREQVLIIGGGETGQFAAWMLNEGSYADSLQVIGYVDDDLFKQGTRIRGSNVLGGRADISRLVRDKDVGIILFSIHNIKADERAQLLDICTSTGARVVVFPDIPAALNGIARKTNSRKSALIPSNSTPLPCHLCLTRVSPMKVDSWLSQLEETAKSGDLESLQAQIQAYREQVRGDAETQLTINLEQEGT